MTTPIIRTENLTRTYMTGAQSVRALCDVSIAIDAGEFVAVEGPSGCGKSTLMGILGLLDSPDNGVYELAGARVNALNFEQRSQIRNQSIGLVFQAFYLVGHLNVLENVLIPLRYSRSIPRHEHQQRALNAIQRVGLADRVQHLPQELSGGQQQRVAIARAIVTDPAVLIADEPTGNLDSHQSDAVMNILKTLHGDGATILLVTHNEHLAGQAGRRIQFRDGKVIDDVAVNRHHGQRS